MYVVFESACGEKPLANSYDVIVITFTNNVNVRKAIFQPFWHKTYLLPSLFFLIPLSKYTKKIINYRFKKA